MKKKKLINLIKNFRDQINLFFYGKSLLTKVGHYISVDWGEWRNGKLMFEL
jgi:hypothetical protein